MVVFGIMNLVFGAFTIGAVIIANAVLLIDLPQDPNNPIAQAAEDPTYKTLSIVMQVGWNGVEHLCCWFRALV